MVLPFSRLTLFGLQYKYESLSFASMKPVPPTPQMPVTAEAMCTASAPQQGGKVARVMHGSPFEQRVLHSQQLFGQANEVLIEHAGFTYRLRITQANKLILTK